jgi:hypothetical protein
VGLPLTPGGHGLPRGFLGCCPLAAVCWLDSMPRNVCAFAGRRKQKAGVHPGVAYLERENSS